MQETITEATAKFEPRRGPYLMIPYCPQNGTDQHQALIDLFFRLKAEKLDSVVFHENPDISLLEFMNFFSGSKTLLQILAIMSEDKVVDICGMAWLADMASCSGGILVKAVGNFLFFADYQKPAYTDPFRDLIFDYWFDVLNLDTLVGLTPSLNRAASIFVKRLGLKELCRIPDYTTYEGQKCDGIVSWMSKESYHASRLE
jgi:hypothetical protein